MAKLTPKQQRFIEEYLIDLNATRAAIAAGYSEKTANQQGPRLLVNVGIAAAIAEAQEERSERTEITQDMVLRELAVLGFSDMGDYIRITDDGSAFFDWSALPDGGTKAISEITQETYVEKGGTKDDPADRVKKTKFKLYDKRAALVDIGRHLGMFKDRLELGVSGDLADLMREIDGRSRNDTALPLTGRAADTEANNGSGKTTR